MAASVSTSSPLPLAQPVVRWSCCRPVCRGLRWRRTVRRLPNSALGHSRLSRGAVSTVFRLPTRAGLRVQVVLEGERRARLSKRTTRVIGMSQAPPWDRVPGTRRSTRCFLRPPRFSRTWSSGSERAAALFWPAVRSPWTVRYSSLSRFRVASLREVDQRTTAPAAIGKTWVSLVAGDAVGDDDPAFFFAARVHQRDLGEWVGGSSVPAKRDGVSCELHRS